MTIGPTAGRTTPSAHPVELGAARSAGDVEAAARLDPRYREPLARVPTGLTAARGLPFLLGDDRHRRWLLVDREVSVDLSGVSATHLVLYHFCDAWRDESGERPPGSPIGWVLPVGEALARVSVACADGGTVDVTLRRRFEVNEGIIGWGSGAFLALPHRVEAPLDPLGPHPRQTPGRGAPAGHAGPMTVLPGSWGAGQTGVEDHIPSATDELMFWLHAIEVGTDGVPRALRSMTLAPVAGRAEGRLVVIGAITAFAGLGSPLRWRPRRSLRMAGAWGSPVGVDLGLVARRRPIAIPLPGAPVIGWGLEPPPPSDAEEIELTAADDAALYLGADRLHIAAVATGRPGVLGEARVEALPPADRRLRVDITDAAGRASAARVRLHARDGRYLAPLGHRDEVNPGIYEDVGAEVQLGDAMYAYVDGSFEIDVPADGASLEVVRGPDCAPIRRDVGADELSQGWLRVAFGEPMRPGAGTWVAGDTHVHFLSPSTALLQARAEGINVVHLLATQWGDLDTGLTDYGADPVSAGGEHAVWVGSENRQNLLGHVGLVGAARPILPFASGGPPEGRIGGEVALLMADWLARCREAGGLAIGAHFPLPMAEVAADIAAGLLDALEIQCFDPTLESPPIREWYRYLDAGYRLPIVGGTDKMSAQVPLGQVRTWARLDDDAGLTFEAWASAIRAGRTFVTSGPLLELSVEGHAPGSELAVDPGARLEVELVARASQPIVSAVELVLDGRVVAAETSPEPVTMLSLRDSITIERTGWLAGRSRSPHAIGSAFASSMGAHTSAVYLDVRGRTRAPVDLSLPLTLVDGTRAWLESLAPIRDARDLDRFRRFLAEAERQLIDRASGGPS